jgi:dTDP-4-amino-4,6-dideoxygalactose transaminase
MIGYNFRLGEIECAIGIEQLKKLDSFVNSRQKMAALLDTKLKGLRGLRTPIVKPDCTHAYYMYPMILDVEELGVTRDVIVKALEAEGVTGLTNGYVNIHLLPMYQKMIAYGSKGFPWTSDICRRQVSYKKGICPVAEKLHEVSFFGFAMCMHELSDEDINLIGDAFKKVWNRMGDLK